MFNHSIFKNPSWMKAVFDHSPMMIVVLDQDHRVRFFNPSWSDFLQNQLQVPADRISSGADLFDLLPEVSAELKEALGRALSGETVRQESLHQKVNGSLVYWDAVWTPVQEGREVIGAVHAGIDATDRALALQEAENTLRRLKEREARLNLVMHGTNDGIWDWNILTDEVYFSPRWKAILGYEDDEIGNSFETWSQLVHPEDLTNAQEALEAHLEGETAIYALEHRLRHKDGSYRWILARGLCIRDNSGQPIRLAGSHTDITDRRKAEEALQESEANLRSLLENPADFVVYRLKVDPHASFGARVLLVSPSIKEILGIQDPYEFTSWFENIHPEDLQKATQANRRAIDEGAPYDQTVRVYNAQKDQWVWLHTKSQPIFDEEGNLTHFNGLIIDVTEQKQAEENLQRQLALENIITSISTNFINLEPEEIDAGIHRALRSIGEYAGVDRSYVFLFSKSGKFMANTHEWCAPEVEPQSHRIQNDSIARLPWFTKKVLNHQVVHVPDIQTLPEEAVVDRQEAQAQGIQSLILVPMSLRGKAIGFLGFDSVRTKKAWTEDSISLLTIVGEIIVSSLERKRAQKALQESKQLISQYAEARTHELATLLDLSRNLSSTLDLEPQLDLILDQLKLVVDYTGASILQLDGDVLKLVAYRGPIPPEKAMQFTFPLSQAEANRKVVQERVPLVIPDVFADTPMASAFRRTAGEDLETTFSYLRSWMGVPLIVRDRTIGMLSLDHPQADFYQATPHVKLALAFANQVAASIENARLYAEVRQRADEAQTLFAVQQAITSRLEPDAVLQMIANEARRLTGTTQGAVYLLNGDELEVAVISGEVSPDMVGYRLPVDGSVAGLALNTGKPFLVSDAEADDRVHADIIRQVGAKSFVIVPLMSSNGPVGTITVANKTEGALGSEEERVLTMLASGAVVALENARLYKEEQERRIESERRRQVAEGLRDILTILNSDRPLNESLEAIVHQAVRLMGSDAGVIYRYHHPDQTLTIDAGCQLPQKLMAMTELPAYSGGAVQAMLERRPYVIEDIATAISPILEQNNLTKKMKDWLVLLVSHYKAYISVPLVIRDEIYGSLGLYYFEQRKVTQEEINLALSFSDQAALAIENARLREQAEQSAVAAERSRLARDLHDAVTQTLFSASLIAEVLPRIWERKPEEGARRLEELRQLTRGALAEMRTLLLELRPSALVEAELNEIFRHLADAFTSRARVPVEFSIQGDRDLPADVKVALYRIAQEALNNVAKHAEAEKATLEIHCTEEGVLLTIADNGRGFDPGKTSAESLGVGIMKERAENIGAELNISSETGIGTSVSVIWTQNNRTN